MHWKIVLCNMQRATHWTARNGTTFAVEGGVWSPLKLNSNSEKSQTACLSFGKATSYLVTGSSKLCMQTDKWLRMLLRSKGQTRGTHQNALRC
eukprot:6445858-Amphidinium_carterae.1